MANLGVGFLGIWHPHFEGRASSLKNIAGVKLVAGYEPSGSELPRLERAGVRAVAEPQAVLGDPAIGLVVIEGDNAFCAQAAEQCARAKKPFLLEKPGAHNLETLQQVVRTVAQHPVPHQVGYHMRFAPSVQRARSLLARGLLGEITLARAHVSVPAPWLEHIWFTRPEDRGGLVYLDACHLVDMVIHLLGRPSRAIGRLLKRRKSTIPFEDGAAAILEYDGMLATFDITGWEANDWVETWEIDVFGTEGTLKIGVHPPWVDLYLKSPRDEFARGWTRWSDPTFPGERNYQLELEAFIAALPHASGAGACTLPEALAAVEVMEQIYVTAQAGGR